MGYGGYHAALIVIIVFGIGAFLIALAALDLRMRSSAKEDRPRWYQTATKPFSGVGWALMGFLLLFVWAVTRFW
jgi:hypothetical protein